MPSQNLTISTLLSIDPLQSTSTLDYTLNLSPIPNHPSLILGQSFFFFCSLLDTISY